MAIRSTVQCRYRFIVAGRVTEYPEHGVYDRIRECRSFIKNSYFLSVDYTKYESMERNTQPLVKPIIREETQISMIQAPLLTLSTLLMSFKRRGDR